MVRSRPADPGWGPGITPARARDRREDQWPPDARPEDQAAQPERLRQSDSTAEDAEILDLERGRTVALVAALGRLQLSLDLMTRTQQRVQEEHSAAIGRLEAQIADLSAALKIRPPT